MELWAFLKIKGLVQTGGQAKVVIREGKVKLNGVVETRKKKKLDAGDMIEIDGKSFTV